MTPWRDVGRYGTVGIELILALAGGYYGGHYLDQKFGGGHGYLTAIGLLLGLFSIVRTFIKLAREMKRAAEREEKQGPWNPKSDPTYDSEYLEAIDRERDAQKSDAPERDAHALDSRKGDDRARKNKP